MEHFAHEFLKASVGAMKSSLEVGDKALKPRAEKFALMNPFRQAGIMLFVTLRADISKAPVLGDMSQLFGKLGRVLNPRLGLRVGAEGYAAIRTL